MNHTNLISKNVAFIRRNDNGGQTIVHLIFNSLLHRFAAITRVTITRGIQMLSDSVREFLGKREKMFWWDTLLRDDCAFSRLVYYFLIIIE